MGTGYYEELIRKYLLDNTHGAIVVVKPEKGRTARMDRELEEKLEQLHPSVFFSHELCARYFTT